MRCDAVRLAVRCRTGGMALWSATLGDRRMGIGYLGRLGDPVEFAALPVSAQADQIARIVG